MDPMGGREVRRVILSGAKDLFAKGKPEPKEYEFMSLQKIETVRSLTEEYEKNLAAVRHKVTVEEEIFSADYPTVSERKQALDKAWAEYATGNDKGKIPARRDLDELKKIFSVRYDELMRTKSNEEVDALNFKDLPDKFKNARTAFEVYINDANVFLKQKYNFINQNKVPWEGNQLEGLGEYKKFVRSAIVNKLEQESMQKGLEFDSAKREKELLSSPSQLKRTVSAFREKVENAINRLARGNTPQERADWYNSPVSALDEYYHMKKEEGPDQKSTPSQTVSRSKGPG